MDSIPILYLLALLLKSVIFPSRLQLEVNTLVCWCLAFAGGEGKMVSWPISIMELGNTQHLEAWYMTSFFFKFFFWTKGKNISNSCLWSYSAKHYDHQIPSEANYSVKTTLGKRSVRTPFKVFFHFLNVSVFHKQFTSDIGVPQKSFWNRFFNGVEGCKSLLSKIAETSSKTKPQKRLFQ